MHIIEPALSKYIHQMVACFIIVFIGFVDNIYFIHMIVGVLNYCHMSVYLCLILLMHDVVILKCVFFMILMLLLCSMLSEIYKFDRATLLPTFEINYAAVLLGYFVFIIVCMK